MWSIEYFRAGKVHLTQVHAAHPALSLVTSVDCMHLLQSALQPCCSQPCQPRRQFWLVMVAVCRSTTTLGTLKVGCWPRKAGCFSIQRSFYVGLSVHGKAVAKIRGRLHQVLLYLCLYDISLAVRPRDALKTHLMPFCRSSFLLFLCVDIDPRAE